MVPVCRIHTVELKRKIFVAHFFVKILVALIKWHNFSSLISIQQTAQHQKIILF